MRTKKSILSGFVITLLLNDIAIALLIFLFANTTTGTILAIVSICLILNSLELAAFNFFSNNHIFKPIKIIGEYLDTTTQADTGAVRRRTDDIRIISLEFKSFADKNNNALSDIRGITDMLATNGHKLSGRMEKAMGDAVEHNTLNGIITGKMVYQNNVINETAKSSEEIDVRWNDFQTLIDTQTTAIHESSKAVLDMISSLGVISGSTEKVSNFSEELLSISQTGGDSINRTLTAIVSVIDMSQKLNDIVEIITDTAAQINLLSINASIEAAHAGTYGSGFAVVAKEIKKLAEKTSMSANNIQKHLAESDETIQYTSRISKDAQNNFMEIFGHVTSIVSQIKEIRLAISEENSRGNELRHHLDNLNRTTSDIHDSSGTMRNTLGNLMTKMSNLKELARETIRTTELMENGIEHFRGEIDFATKLVEDNNLQIGKITEEINSLS